MREGLTAAGQAQGVPARAHVQVQRGASRRRGFWGFWERRDDSPAQFAVPSGI